MDQSKLVLSVWFLNSWWAVLNTSSFPVHTKVKKKFLPLNDAYAMHALIIFSEIIGFDHSILFVSFFL